ncbi:MAG: sulfotransferase [Myxococcota bacterium]
MESRLIFLISAPRSGSTLLARMLGAHSAIAAGPEPHLISPLACLGYFERVESAAYDPVLSQMGIRELVRRLPDGEKVYLEACRAYSDALYRAWLNAQPPSEWVLDKTPAYALFLDFLERLYPNARYLVLTRTPLAILWSQVESFFDGDFAAAERQSPVLARYVPAIARFLRESATARLHLHYEQLVAEPRAQMERVLGFLGLGFEEATIEYGSTGQAASPASRGLGDPVGVSRHDRPVTSSSLRWASALGADPERRSQALRALERLDDADLETWGYPRNEILRALEAAAPGSRAARRPFSRYALERKLLVLLRRNIHHNALGRLVRRVRLACDVLLR